MIYRYPFPKKFMIHKNLNLVSKHINTSLLESPDLLVALFHKELFIKSETIMIRK